MLNTLENLFNLARERRKNPIKGSYTNKLLNDKSLSKAKVLEEIGELIEAVEKGSNKIHEAADVFYHLIMYLEANDIKIEEVMLELNKRKKWVLMGKIKIIFFIILVFVVYKGVVAFKNFEIGVGDRVAMLEEQADFEKEGEVVGLIMYLDGELQEHLYAPSRSKCLKMKEIAEETSYAEYECAVVLAVLQGNKILEIIEEIEVIEWNMMIIIYLQKY